MSHPNLGLPPRDMTAGFPDAAARLVAARERIGTRALELALDGRPEMRARYDELGLRRLLRDSFGYVDQVARAIASDDPVVTGEWANQVAPVFRRRRVPMDDLIALSEGLRGAQLAVLSPIERPSADRAIDAAIATFRWYRRLAGDARARNPILQAIYKGA